MGESTSGGTVMFVHQSADLYGSDRVLLELADGIRPAGYEPLVVLPQQGPLVDALRARDIRTHVARVGKVSKASAAPGGVAALPVEIVRSVAELDRIAAGRDVRAVYTNTLAVLGSPAWAALRRRPHIWHVHELLVEPPAARRAFPRLVSATADRVVCVSAATRDWLVAEQPRLAPRSQVVANGLPPRPAPQPDRAAALRASLRIPPEAVVVTLVGRINRWKGQPLLVAAMDLLAGQFGAPVHALIVGSAAAGQESFEDDLAGRIAASSARSRIHRLSFTPDVWTVWDASDIAVVPSTDPEPFGLVAIEAMASGLPVIAAGHGGLADIVVDRETGRHIAPGSATQLAAAISDLAGDPVARHRMGEAGRARQERCYAVADQIDAITRIVADAAGARRH